MTPRAEASRTQRKLGASPPKASNGEAETLPAIRSTQTNAPRGDDQLAIDLVRLEAVEPDDGLEDEGPFFAWLPPDDRLWRHPSEGLERTPSRAGDHPGLSDGIPASTFLTTVMARPVTKIWSVAIVAGLIGALAASGLGMVSGVFDQQTTVIHAVMPSTPVVSLAADTGAGDWHAVDNAIAPSVVAITVLTAGGILAGSGLLIPVTGGSRAYVITDSSILDEGGRVEVSFASGQQAQGSIVGYDQMTGLGLIAVPNTHQALPPLGSVASLHIADAVLAVGARTSSGGSVFQGSVTAEDQQVDQASGPVMQSLIAVSGSSTIPSTASGGPLVDQEGEVVGITVSVNPVDPTEQGLTFAVPVDVANQVAKQLLARETVTHPWLGVVNSSDITSAQAHQFGVQGGALVVNVSPDSPASELGLDPMDIITALNGQPVTSSGTLTDLLCQAQPGHSLVLSYLHKGKPVKATVKVWSQPPGD